MLKKCTKCGKERDISFFNKGNRYKDGYQSWCKPCKRVSAKAHRKPLNKGKKEERKVYLKKYYKENKKKVRATQKRYAKNNTVSIKAKQKQWYNAPALYNTHYLSIHGIEDCRNNAKLLEVKCAYCGRWYMPTNLEVANRRESIDSLGRGERRFYCSLPCKKECAIYRKHKWPSSIKEATSREIQPELRQLVFKRDNYKCVLCDSVKALHCHHLTGVEQNPIESADVDNCITLCKQCHKYVHSKEGCRYYELRGCL